MAKTISTTQERLREQVKGYALTLESAARGELYDDEPELREEYGDDISAYFSDVLDVEYVIGGDGSYRGAIITLACGGPGIVFDTRKGTVRGEWGWSDTAEYPVQGEAVRAIDDYFEEMYSYVR